MTIIVNATSSLKEHPGLGTRLILGQEGDTPPGERIVLRSGHVGGYAGEGLFRLSGVSFSCLMMDRFHIEGITIEAIQGDASRVILSIHKANPTYPSHGYGSSFVDLSDLLVDLSCSQIAVHARALGVPASLSATFSLAPAKPDERALYTLANIYALVKHGAPAPLSPWLATSTQTDSSSIVSKEDIAHSLTDALKDATPFDTAPASRVVPEPHPVASRLAKVPGVAHRPVLAVRTHGAGLGWDPYGDLD